MNMQFSLAPTRIFGERKEVAREALTQLQEVKTMGKRLDV